MEENSAITDHNDIDQYIEHLSSGKRLSEASIAKLCEKAKEVLSEESNIVFLNVPMTIVGRISGQLDDLIEIFNVIGKPPDANYLFLGNYYLVGGQKGVETFCLVLALKVRYKNRVTLLRGFGEDRSMSQAYRFLDECARKYSNHNVWKMLTEIFDYLPLSAVIDNTFFCLFGGLTPNVHTLDEIQKLPPAQIDNEAYKMIWSEPGCDEEWRISHRGCGYLFPKKASEKFLYTNNLRMICQGLGFSMEGYGFHHDGLVASINSNPNCKFRCGNYGAVAEVDEHLNMNFVQFWGVSRLDYDEKRNPDHFIDQSKVKFQW